MGAFERGRPNKTGEFDESVMMDWPVMALSGYFEALQRRRAGQRVWTFDSLHLTSVLKRSAELALCDHLLPQLYSLRHGGASWDALEKRRDIMEIKKRGRWRSDASVRRYEKAALALRETHRLPMEAIEFGRFVDQHLSEILAGARPPPLPPKLGRHSSASRPGSAQRSGVPQ